MEVMIFVLQMVGYLILISVGIFILLCVDFVIYILIGIIRDFGRNNQ